MRLVSMVPSVTETLSAWRLDPVACTRFCERDDIPSVGGTKDPDIEAIVQLRPDLVIVDAEENRREDYEALVAREIPVHVLHIRSLMDVDPAMSALSTRINGSWNPPSLPARKVVRLRALVPIWRRPWMALGAPTYGASVLDFLGVALVLSERGPYPEFSLDEAIGLRPDVVLAPSEPYPFTRRQLPELQSVAPTTFVDGKDLFWWGERTHDALRRLSEMIEGL
jgi:ABC-type Fe3+-hydroxamate transport system substrate-binding protein